MQIKGLDAVDNKILALLSANGRLSYSEIGEKIGLSRTAVKNRIDAMETQGIIAGYKAIINPQKAKQTVSFILDLETKAENFETAKSKLKEAEETIAIAQTTGNCHLTIVCTASSVEELRAFISKACKEIEGITSISAHGVLDVIKGNIVSNI